MFIVLSLCKVVHPKTMSYFFTFLFRVFHMLTAEDFSYFYIVLFDASVFIIHC